MSSSNLFLEKMLFLDIETTTQHPSIAECEDEKFKEIFRRRFAKEIAELGEEEAYNVKGPIYPEIGKIICISVGMIKTKGPDIGQFFAKSFTGDEKQILSGLLSLRQIVDWDKPGPVDSKCVINGHNVLNFDIPYIAKRIIINGFKLPAIFNLMGKKPWDIKHIIDTKELWKMGVFDGASNSALDTLSWAFGIQSPKDDISGKDVKDVYWKTGDILRIATYCEKDIFGQAEVYLRMIDSDLRIER